MIQVSPVTWYRHSLRGAKPPFLGQSVPCGSCTQCCRGVHVELTPGADDVNGDFSGYQLDPDAAVPTLARQADGSCFYLRDNRCTIYQYRPYVCRTFDCRALLIADVHFPAHLYEAASEKFAVVCKAPDDRAWLDRVRQKAIELQAAGRPAATIIYDALDAETIAALRAKARGRAGPP